MFKGRPWETFWDRPLSRPFPLPGVHALLCKYSHRNEVAIVTVEAKGCSIVAQEFAPARRLLAFFCALVTSQGLGDDIGADGHAVADEDHLLVGREGESAGRKVRDFGQEVVTEPPTIISEIDAIAVIFTHHFQVLAVNLGYDRHQYVDVDADGFQEGMPDMLRQSQVGEVRNSALHIDFGVSYCVFNGIHDRKICNIDHRTSTRGVTADVSRRSWSVKRRSSFLYLRTYRTPARLLRPSRSKNMNSLPGLIIIVAVMAVAYYFLFSRKKLVADQKASDSLANIGAGDRVITKGGLLGDVQLVEDDVVLIEVGQGVSVRVVRSYIDSVVSKADADLAAAA